MFRSIGFPDVTSIKDTWLDWYKDRRMEDGVAPLVGRLLEAKARRVLDFGTGTGRHTTYLAKIGFDVYGCFDWSQAAITAAKEELAKNGLTAVLRVWDMNDTPLPYDDSFFDAVVAVKVLHDAYFQKILQITSEIQRITRSGGFAYVVSPTYDKVMKQKQQGMSFDEPEPGTFISLNGNEIGIPHHHFRRNEMFQLLGNFRIISFEERDEHFCFTGTKS